MTDGSWAASALPDSPDEFWSHLEKSFPVSLITTFGKLIDCDVSDRLEEVLAREDAEPFDHLEWGKRKMA